MIPAGLQWILLLPTASVAIGGMLILLLDLGFGPEGDRANEGVRRGLLLTMSGSFALIVSIAAGFAFLASGQPASFDALQGHFQVDGLAGVSIMVVGIGGLLVSWQSSTYWMALSVRAPEFFALILFSLSGAFAALCAEHGLILFAGLELMCLPVHVLAAFDRGRLRGTEAALKSFLTSALASAILLYGLALLYGATGRLDFAGIRQAFDPESPYALAGVALAIAGIGLKAGLAPFHQWVPDTDEGAPTAVTAFVSVCVRTAALLLLLRFVLHALPSSAPLHEAVFGVLAVVGIAVGSVMATVQRNIKRLLAYAGIAQAGLAILAFAAATPEAYGAMIFYLLAQVFMTLGALTVLATLAVGGREIERLEDFAGIGQARPALAALMTIFLVGLSALPGTAGFWARLELLRAVLDGAGIGLVLVALLGSVVCLYAYMRIPIMMYMRDAPEAEPSEASTTEIAVLLACAGATLYLGFFPDPLLPGLAAPLGETLRAVVTIPS